MGHKVEVVFAKIVAIPPDLSVYPHRSIWANTVEQGMNSLMKLLTNASLRLGRHSCIPKNFVSLGYDISQAIPNFHSAIRQPGLVNTCPDLPKNLNENGLFGYQECAEKFMSEANQMDYGSEPHCVIEVSLVND